MICCTSRVSRALSVCIRPANRVTASGSSAASWTASASRFSAPDRGLQLVRDVGDEVAADRLDAALAGAVLDQREHQPAARAARPARSRAAARRPGPRDITSSVSRICPSRRTCRTSSASSSTATSLSRTSPKAYAGAEALRTSSFSSTTSALERRTESTVAMPGGHGGLLDGRRLVHLRLADPPREDDAGAEHRAEQREEERLRRTVHGSIVRPVSSGVRLVRGSLTCAFSDCSPRVHASSSPGRRGFTWDSYRSPPCAMPTSTSSTRSSTSSST